MTRQATANDTRQGALFDDAPPARPRTSDERAVAEMMRIVETLESAKTHPWSARLLGWQRRTFDALAQRLTPIEAAALASRLESELERLGPAED